MVVIFAGVLLRGGAIFSKILPFEAWTRLHFSERIILHLFQFQFPQSPGFSVHQCDIYVWKVSQSSLIMF